MVFEYLYLEPKCHKQTLKSFPYSSPESVIPGHIDIYNTQRIALHGYITLNTLDIGMLHIKSRQYNLLVHLYNDRYGP